MITLSFLFVRYVGSDLVSRIFLSGICFPEAPFLSLKWGDGVRNSPGQGRQSGPISLYGKRFARARVRARAHRRFDRRPFPLS